MKVVTRFAPSPTGALHIGSVRTALFNYLFARHNKGKFFLRIEDTDTKRSKQVFIEQILKSLQDLGIDYDDHIRYQSSNQSKYQEVVQRLLDSKNAYYCLSTKNSSEQQDYTLSTKWRDKNLTKEDVKNKNFVIRLKTPNEGTTTIKDLVQGDVSIKNQYIEDTVLLRSDNSPTYNLACVVDDHYMEISHVIRGDDHLNNSARQQLIYKFLGWKTPHWAHIALIHNSYGQKLSKRSGDWGIDYYLEDLGYLPEALFNYLLRLGWSWKEKEIFSKQEAIELFNLESIGRSPARFDIEKLNYLNKFYIKKKTKQELIEKIQAHYSFKLDKKSLQNIEQALEDMQKRVTTLNDLYDMSKIYMNTPIRLGIEEIKYLKDNCDDKIIYILDEALIKIKSTEDIVEVKNVITETITSASLRENIEKKKLFTILRILVTGKISSPGIYGVISILGREVVLKRINNYNNGKNSVK